MQMSMTKQTWKAVVSAAAIAASATLPMAAEAATIVTQTINNVEWRFQLDPSKGTATIGLGKNTEAGHVCPSDAVLDASQIPWMFTGDDGVEYTVTAIAAEAFRTLANITGTITIPYAVKTVGTHAFNSSGITGLAGATGVTKWESYVFSGGITGTYPDLSNVTSLGESVFGSVPLTGRLILGSGLTTIPRVAFYQWNISGTAIVPRNVTTINDFSGKGVFGECPNLTAIWVKGPATTDDQTYTTIGMRSFAQKSYNVEFILMGQNTKGSNRASSNYMLGNVTGAQVFVPANGYWDGLVTGGTNNKVWYYGATNELDLAVDDSLMSATFTPTTVNAFTNAIEWVSAFKTHFDLDARISVTNTLDLAGVTITPAMVLDVTFDRLMFAAKTQAQLNAILTAFPAATPISIDPTGLTENMVIPNDYPNVFVKTVPGVTIKRTASGFMIIVK